MKNHQKNVTFSIPADMVGESGFAPDCEITIHTGENLLAVVPQEMTAIQLVRALSSLTAVSCELIHVLRAACGECGDCQDGCPFEDAPEPDAELSQDVREELGIPQGHKLRVEVCGDVAHVSDAGYEHDITDVPTALLEALALGGICLGRLDELLISGEVIYHG